MKENIFNEPRFWLALLIGGFFLALTLWFNLTMDQSIFYYGVWVWEKYQQPPYLGVWDHNFPGMFLIARLALAIFGPSVFGFRLFDILVQLIGLGMIYYLAQRLSGTSLAGFLAAVFYGIYYYSLRSAGVGQREAFIFWLLLLCLVLAVTLGRRVWLRAGLIGLLLGFVFLVKPTYGLCWPVFGIYFLAKGIKARPRLVWAELVVFGVFCLAPAVATLLYYWRLDYLPELYQSVVLFNSKVYTQMLDQRANEAAWWLIAVPALVFKDWPLILFSALLLPAVSFRRGLLAKDKDLFWLIFFLILAALANYRMGAKYFPYQLIPFWGLLIIYSAFSFAWLMAWAGRKTGAGTGKFLKLIFSAALIFLMVLNLDPGMRKFARKYAFRGLDRAYAAGFNSANDRQMTADFFQTAGYLKPMLKPEDEVLVFGGYPLVNLLLQKKTPSRFVCTHHLLLLRHDGVVEPFQKQWLKEYSSAVMQARPRFFVVPENWPAQFNILYHFSTRELWPAFRIQFPELNAFFLKNYKLKTKIGRIWVYESMPSVNSGK